MFVFVILLTFLLGSPFPLLMLGLYVILREQPRLLNLIRVASLVCLIAYWGFFFSGSGVRFTNDGANSVAGALAIGSYCFLASSVFEIPSMPLRVTALFILGVPICMLTALATFALAFPDPPPYRTEQMRTDLVCRQSSYGIVGAGGDRIGLYKSWPGFPFIEKLVAGDQSEDTVPKTNLSSCADLLRQYDDRNAMQK